jgi:hypothetical protein
VKGKITTNATKQERLRDHYEQIHADKLDYLGKNGKTWGNIAPVKAYLVGFVFSCIFWVHLSFSSVCKITLNRHFFGAGLVAMNSFCFPL